MKGIICYYSGSGNTKLACEYIKKRIHNADFDLFNIVKDGSPDLSKYDIVGFATFSNYGDVARYIYSFFDRIIPYPGKNAFVFNTYGLLTGRTLKVLESLAKKKKFKVITGFSLHTPESYVPLRVKNMTFDDAPSQSELIKFDNCISKLDERLMEIQSGVNVKEDKLKVGFLNTFVSAIPRPKNKKAFGEQNVNVSLCKQCKTCKDICPYNAISLNPFPVFDHVKCNGCWACYNHCPEKAIYVKKFKGEGQYPKPSAEYVSKLQYV